MAMFLAGDIGSHGGPDHRPADPRSRPATAAATAALPQVEQTGNRIADHVADQARERRPVPLGTVNGAAHRVLRPAREQPVPGSLRGGPLRRASGLHELHADGQGRQRGHTSVSVLDVGPDLQFIANPGEAFPALMLGGPWGIEDASCPNRAEPAGAHLACPREVPVPGRARPTT